jgi:cell division protein FtsB
VNRTSLNEPAGNRYQRIFHDGYDNAAQHWKKGLVILLTGIVALCAWEFVAGNQGILAQKKLEATTAQLARDNAELDRQVKDLAEQNRLLATSDFVAEKTIRETLLRAKPGEMIYLFDESAAGGTPMTFDDVLVVPTPPKKEKPESR